MPSHGSSPRTTRKNGLGKQVRPVATLETIVDNEHGLLHTREGIPAKILPCLCWGTLKVPCGACLFFFFFVHGGFGGDESQSLPFGWWGMPFVSGKIML